MMHKQTLQRIQEKATELPQKKCFKPQIKKRQATKDKFALFRMHYPSLRVMWGASGNENEKYLINKTIQIISFRLNPVVWFMKDTSSYLRPSGWGKNQNKSFV